MASPMRIMDSKNYPSNRVGFRLSEVHNVARQCSRSDGRWYMADQARLTQWPELRILS
jgi:hypothetical protein